MAPTWTLCALMLCAAQLGSAFKISDDGLWNRQPTGKSGKKGHHKSGGKSGKKGHHKSGVKSGKKGHKVDGKPGGFPHARDLSLEPGIPGEGVPADAQLSEGWPDWNKVKDKLGDTAKDKLADAAKKAAETVGVPKEVTRLVNSATVAYNQSKQFFDKILQPADDLRKLQTQVNEIINSAPKKKKKKSTNNINPNTITLALETYKEIEARLKEVAETKVDFPESLDISGAFDAMTAEYEKVRVKFESVKGNLTAIEELAKVKGSNLNTQELFAASASIEASIEEVKTTFKETAKTACADMKETVMKKLDNAVEEHTKSLPEAITSVVKDQLKAVGESLDTLPKEVEKYIDGKK